MTKGLQIVMGFGLLATSVIALYARQRSSYSPQPTPIAPRPEPARVFDDGARARDSLTATPRDGAFEVADGAHHVTLTLPSQPTVQGDLASQGGVSVFNAQALMPGGPVDVELGVMTMTDGDLPAELVSVLEASPAQLATASGGTLAKNESTTLIGFPGQRYELTTPDHRRLFGWMVVVSPHARVYQLNCVGADDATSRTACEKIFGTLALR